MTDSWMGILSCWSSGWCMDEKEEEEKEQRIVPGWVFDETRKLLLLHFQLKLFNLVNSILSFPWLSFHYMCQSFRSICNYEWFALCFLIGFTLNFWLLWSRSVVCSYDLWGFGMDRICFCIIRVSLFRSKRVFIFSGLIRRLVYVSNVT